MELCRDRVDGNSNENGASTMDDYCRDVHEIEVDDMIDGGLEALLDLRDNEFEEESMAHDHNDDKCDGTARRNSTIVHQCKSLVHNRTAKINDRPPMRIIGVHCHRRVIMISQQLTGSGMTGDGQ